MNTRIINSFKFIFLFSIFCCFAGCSDETTNPDPDDNLAHPVLFVANQGTGQGFISLVDLTSHAIVGNAANLGDNPIDMTVWEDKLLVVNLVSNNMNIISIEPNNIVSSDTTIDLGSSQNRGPRCIDVSDTGYAYIGNYLAGTLTVHDLNKSLTLQHLEVGDFPVAVKVLGRKVFVCNSGEYSPGLFSAGTVTVINRDTGLPDTTLNVGINPRAMAVDQEGNLHVLCKGDNSSQVGMIWKFDPNNNVLLFTFTLGGHPEDIAITSTNVAYVAAGDDGGDPGLVYRYDARTGEILNGPANPIEGIGRGASRIAIADDNSVYVSCTFVNRVDKIVGDMKVSSFDVGERPVSLAVYQNSEE